MFYKNFRGEILFIVIVVVVARKSMQRVRIKKSNRKIKKRQKETRKRKKGTKNRGINQVTSEWQRVGDYVCESVYVYVNESECKCCYYCFWW